MRQPEDGDCAVSSSGICLDSIDATRAIAEEGKACVLAFCLMGGITWACFKALHCMFSSQCPKKRRTCYRFCWWSFVSILIHNQEAAKPCTGPLETMTSVTCCVLLCRKYLSKKVALKQRQTTMKRKPAQATLRQNLGHMHCRNKFTCRLANPISLPQRT